MEQQIHGRWKIDGLSEPNADKAEDSAKDPESSVTVVQKELQE